MLILPLPFWIGAHLFKSLPILHAFLLRYHKCECIVGRDVQRPGKKVKHSKNGALVSNDKTTPYPILSFPSPQIFPITILLIVPMILHFKDPFPMGLEFWSSQYTASVLNFNMFPGTRHHCVITVTVPDLIFFSVFIWNSVHENNSHEYSHSPCGHRCHGQGGNVVLV